MNMFDKAIAYVNPERALKRQVARAKLNILNSGYSNGGASHTKRSMKGFTDKSYSPQNDIDANLDTLRHRSRSLFMNTPIATGAIRTSKTNVVGSGLKLKSRIDYDFLGMTEDEAEKWQSQVEREFALWAETRACDALRLNNFYEMQGLVFLGQLINGDGFCLLKFKEPTMAMPYALRLQLLESDRVCTPYGATMASGSIMEYQSYYGVNEKNNNTIYSGVEIDKDGATVAYHICNQYPYATNAVLEKFEWTRVEAYGAETGRPNILHIFEAERAEQRRGVPLLAPVIEELKQLKRYSDAELMAAVISGMFTVFVTTDAPTTQLPIGEAIPTSAAPIEKDVSDYELGNGAIVTLAEGEKVTFADPQRPNSAFDSFINSMCQNIGAALEIPKELLLKTFNSSYSASRAALLEAWKKFRGQREWLAKEFCQPIYEQFLIEAVARGRIKAPGFFKDPVIQKAWCGADWNGAAMGMIDPVKEVTAAIKRVEQGFSTRAEETIGLTGGDYSKNIKQLKRENALLDEANKELTHKLSNQQRGANSNNGTGN